jgi:hypothetical protein
LHGYNYSLTAEADIGQSLIFDREGTDLENKVNSFHLRGTLARWRTFKQTRNQGKAPRMMKTVTSGS